MLKKEVIPCGVSYIVTFSWMTFNHMPLELLCILQSTPSDLGILCFTSDGGLMVFYHDKHLKKEISDPYFSKF